MPTLQCNISVSTTVELGIYYSVPSELTGPARVVVNWPELRDLPWTTSLRRERHHKLEREAERKRKRESARERETVGER